jgi:hypothetical protein
VAYVPEIHLWILIKTTNETQYSCIAGPRFERLTSQIQKGPKNVCILQRTKYLRK